MTQCPQCSRTFEVEDNQLGGAVRCRFCSGLFLAIEAPPDADSPDPRREGESSRTALKAIPEQLRPDNLVKVEAGSFMQGDASGCLFERPSRCTRISYDFSMSRCPVSQREYYSIMYSNPSYFRSNELPVENITWHEAMAFCRKLNEILQARKILPAGMVCRLPTEAEWEYACRTTPGESSPEHALEPLPRYWWGSEADALERYAWYVTNSEEQTHPAGTKEANPRGFLDMLGNVAEWCMDWFDVYADEKEVSDPCGAKAGNRKVRRGGSWGSIAWRCRPTDRLGVKPECRSALLGFRVVLAPPTGGELPAANVKVI